ncbi:MAG: DUF1294 domain-containing protein [Clostridiaceae bacterium]|nr:DUF1294 domain-containing protein [Clostridiaceae bacterium]
MDIFVVLLIAYLVIINLVAFCQMGADKHRAKAGARRIRERVLFFTALIGGSVGANLGMSVFRHKTKHRSFVIGMPAILILHIVIAAVLYIL